MIYRFVQLSDIHFGQERAGEVVVHEDVRQQLIADAARMAHSRGSADLVIVAGDIAYAAQDSEYKSASDWLDLVTKAVKCRETDVRVVPGNHDCDRGALNRVALNAHRDIRKGTPKSAYADLADFAAVPEEQNPLLPKLRAYREFAAGYSSDFASVARPLWIKDFPLIEGITLRLVGMNSVQVSDKDDRPANMILGNAQYILPEDHGIIYAVALHHPLDWYMDRAEAKQYLHNRARLIMVGHEHIPDIHKTMDVLGNERLDIHSGATNPPESGELFRYAYNWIEISLKSSVESHCLAINIFPRVWVPERVRFDADVQRLAGKDSAEFLIACRDLKRAITRAQDQDLNPQPAPETSSTSAPVSRGSLPNGGNMHIDDDIGLARLRLLFWRHLDWQQRLKVLVEADALPSTASRPVPQTMERLAIENARARGKLAAVWDAMMTYVPDSKKEANPFTKTGS